MTLLPLLFLACASVSTLQGARPLEPGYQSFQVGLSLQDGTNAASAATGLPLPQLELAWRKGLSTDVDWGLRTYLVGAYGDVRYRFWHNDTLHLAVAPGVGGTVLPLVVLNTGSLDVNLPVLAEMELGPRASIVLGARAMAHESWAWASLGEMGRGGTGRYDLLAGGMGRFQVKGPHLSVGVFTDVLANTTRASSPWWSGGVDLGIELDPRQKGEKKGK